MAKAKQATTKIWWVKKPIFLWSGSSFYGPEYVFTHVTESSVMGFSGTRRKALELWKNRYVFNLFSWSGCTRPVDQIERTWGVTAGADLGVFKCFQLFPPLLFSCHYWLLSFKSNTEKQNLHYVGLKGLKSHNSIILHGSFYFLLVHLFLKRVCTLFLP